MNAGTAQNNPHYEIVLIVFLYWRWQNAKIFHRVALILYPCRSMTMERVVPETAAVTKRLPSTCVSFKAY